MFTDQVIEIDLYTRLRQERSFVRYEELEELIVLIPNLRRTIVLPLSSTQQLHGRRMSFLCPRCTRRVQKLYVQVWQFNAGNWAVACRKCHKLKYISHYRKNRDSREELNESKLARLEGQKRRYWYDDKPTQFGKRYQRLRDERQQLREEFWASIHNSRLKLEQDFIKMGVVLPDRRVSS